jgi:hypothetical protein
MTGLQPHSELIRSLTLRRACLDYMLVLGEQYLRKILAEYARHDSSHRPHQPFQQRPPLRNPGHAVDVTARIEHRRVVAGLISEYRRAWRARIEAGQRPMTEFRHGCLCPVWLTLCRAAGNLV